jgi:ABC-type phosphonate transport system ATPase subunit
LIMGNLTFFDSWPNDESNSNDLSPLSISNLMLDLFSSLVQQPHLVFVTNPNDAKNVSVEAGFDASNVS